MKEKTTSPAIDWATLRPTVTDTLLADITRRIVEKFHPYKIVLFGSHAYGDPGLGRLNWLWKLSRFLDPKVFCFSSCLILAQEDFTRAKNRETNRDNSGPFWTPQG